MDKDHQEKFARLLALSKIREAQIKANPVPYLNEMTQKYCELRAAVERAMYELSGAGAFDLAVEAFPAMQPSIVETATMRNRKAHDILATALK